MKVICCDICEAFIPLEKNEWQICRCGNIGGMYLADGLHAQVAIENDIAGRVLGVPNSVRAGHTREGTCWVFKKDTDRIEFVGSKE